MENSHKYFKRDISWLSFNYRVLLEAEDETLPIYERIKFLSIYSSNLEEFYEIRVAEHRGVIKRGGSRRDACRNHGRGEPTAARILSHILQSIAGIEPAGYLPVSGQPAGTVS